MSKLILFGVDCGNPYLVRSWIDDLPNFRRFHESGYGGILESTIPSITIPSWLSLFSGKNPGKLGVYEFTTLPYYITHGLGPSNPRFSATQFLWDILSKRHIKSIFSNIPGTYPPSPVSGTMISGGITAPLFGKVNYTYPPDLQSEIESRFGRYEILPLADLLVRGREAEYLSSLEKNIDIQIGVLRYIMQREEWEFMSHVFFVTDMVQHYFWNHLDESYYWKKFGRNPEWKLAIKSIYQKVDASIGTLIGTAGDDVNVMIVSDHGSGPQYMYFMANEWLRKIGALTTLRRVRSRTELAFLRNSLLNQLESHLMSRFQRPIEKLLPMVPKKFLQNFTLSGRERRSHELLIDSIDWERTRAYYIGHYGGIYVNLRGREPRGSVLPEEYESVRSEIMQSLVKLQDPVSHEPLSVQVFKREDIYRGRFVDLAPDVVFIIDDYRYLQKPDLTGGLWELPETPGGHSRHGMFVAHGPSIRRGGGLDTTLSVYDILPTLLHLLNLSVPEDVDGRVLSEIFSQGSLPKSTPVSFEAPEEGSKGRYNFESVDERQIEERLRKLGYT